MPGSPYLENKPKGLWTWQDVIRKAISTIIMLTFVAYWLGYLLEWLVALTIISFARFIIKR